MVGGQRVAIQQRLSRLPFCRRSLRPNLRCGCVRGFSELRCASMADSIPLARAHIVPSDPDDKSQRGRLALDSSAHETIQLNRTSGTEPAASLAAAAGGGCLLGLLALALGLLGELSELVRVVAWGAGAARGIECRAPRADSPSKATDNLRMPVTSLVSATGGGGGTQRRPLLQLRAFLFGDVVLVPVPNPGEAVASRGVGIGPAAGGNRARAARQARGSTPLSPPASRQ